MKTTPLSTILWTPRNLRTENLLERKTNFISKTESYLKTNKNKITPFLPRVNAFPFYNPTKKFREVMNIMYKKPQLDIYI